jgi:hypothetical protein
MNCERDLALLEHDHRTVAADLVDEHSPLRSQLDPRAVGDEDRSRLIVGHDQRPSAELGAASLELDLELEQIAAGNLQSVTIGQRDEDRQGAGSDRETSEAPSPRAGEAHFTIDSGDRGWFQGLQQPSASASVLVRIIEQQLLILSLAYGRKQARRAIGSVGH